MFKVFTKWMHDTATVLFDDTKNDLRALPKTVRLQILIVLSALWSTAFSIWVFTVPMFVYGWAWYVFRSSYCNFCCLLYLSTI